MTPLADRLHALGACDPAVKWVAAQSDQRSEALWGACRDGSWLLWLPERAGADCSEMGFVCAERARQSALRALPPSPARDALAACAPVVDRETATAAMEAAGWAETEEAAREAPKEAWAAQAARWAAKEARAARAARSAQWGAEARAAAAGREAARAAELAVIADLVREQWPVPPREVLEMLGGWR